MSSYLPRYPQPVDRLVKEYDMTSGSEIRCADEMRRN